MKALFLPALIAIPVFFSSCKTEDKASATPAPVPTAYFPKVKAIIQSNCTISCHAPSKDFNMGLPVVLEDDNDIAAYHQSIKASVADSATLKNKRMPLGGSLTAPDIDIIVKWAAKGGKITD